MVVASRPAVKNRLYAVFRNPGFDPESGLHYNFFRYYDTETGRYISVDPARSGLNFYAYCKANPLNFIDPYGLCPNNGYTFDELMQILESGVVGLDVEGYTTDDRLLNIANHIFGYDNLINFWSTGDYSQLAEGGINLASMLPFGAVVRVPAASEKVAVNMAKLIEKELGKDARRAFHDLKSGCDRTLQELKDDVKIIYDQYGKGKKPPRWMQ
jgi:RHS repeat-associated protein